MTVTFMTHRGAVRPENQDAVQIAALVRGGDMSGPESVEAGEYPLLLSVVDGMGGYEGGARAAKILADTLAAGSSGSFGAELDIDEDTRTLKELLKAAALQMTREALRDPELSKMGAAVSGLLVRKNNALAFNCGDCRTYRFSGEELEKLTHDHSVVQKLFDEELITEDDMRHHPRKNTLTSAVAAKEAKDFDLYVKGVSRCAGDTFFLCSDGVWETLGARQLRLWLELPSTEAARGMFDALIAAGCRDNVSFIRLGEDVRQ